MIKKHPQWEIMAPSSHHGLSYFHLNDVLIDVIPIVLTRHTVIDVILTQVMLTGEKHTYTLDQQTIKTHLTQRINSFTLWKRARMPLSSCSDRRKAPSSQTSTSSLSFASLVWRIILLQSRGHSTCCSQTSTELRYWVAFPFNEFTLLWHPAS